MKQRVVECTDVRVRVGMMRVLAKILVLASILSCSTVTEPEGTATATVVRQTTENSGALDLTLDVVVTNEGSTPLWLMPCSASMERLDANNRWQNVWSAVCTLIAPADPFPEQSKILPGESRSVTLGVYAAARNGSWPSVDRAGTYRLQLWLVAPPPDGLRTSVQLNAKTIAVATNAFALTAR